MRSVINKYQAYSTEKKATVISLLALLYIFVFATPAITNLLKPNLYMEHVGQQMKDPFSPIHVDNPLSHMGKLTFRLTVPVIGYLLPFLSLKGKLIFIYIIRLIMGFYLFRKLYLFINEIFDYKYLAEALTFSLSFIWVGKSFINDFMWFDEIAFFFLFLTMVSRSSIIIFISAILACFTDERAYLSLLIVFAFRLFFEKGKVKDGIFSVKFFIKEIFKNWAIPIALALCFALRIYLNKQHGFEIGEVKLFEYLTTGNLDYYSIGLWAGFKNLWLIILAGFYLLFRNRKFFIVSILVITLLLNLIVASSVMDLTRSINYSFPLLLIFMFYITELMKNATQEWRTKMYYLLITIVICSFIVPPIMVAEAPDIHHNLLLKLLEHR